MTWRFPLATTLSLLLTAGPVLRAQVVRGTVTERVSAAPLAGILVSLVNDSARTVGTSLTSERGEFAIRAPAAGRYRLDVKRIGVKRSRSDLFDLGSGETKQLDLQMDALLYTLPEVIVLATPMCTRAGGDPSRVASLWDEARTALTATQISLRDRLFRARVIRYVRDLDPRGLKVLEENRADAEGVMDRPFYSLAAVELSKNGFWRRMPDESTIYYAPDAAVLVSDEFLGDHCFRAVEGTRDRRGLTGLNFEPVRGRDTQEVRGTLWLDARTFELRLVEFKYTGLGELGADSVNVGGEVHFARLKSGAWVVRRWFIRMPQLGRAPSSPVNVTGATPSVLVRSVVARLREEGGDVIAEGMRLFETPATVAGTVLDSARAPLAGATVRLAGTAWRTVVQGDGTFRIDSIPAGSFDVIVENPGYTALGLVVADGAVILKEGDVARLNFRARDTRGIVTALCEGKRAPPSAQRATLRVVVRDSAQGTPLAFISLALTWQEFSVAGREVGARMRELSGTSDGRGAVPFCDVPSNTLLTINRLSRAGGRHDLTPLHTLRLEAGIVATDEVRVFVAGGRLPQ